MPRRSEIRRHPLAQAACGPSVHQAEADYYDSVSRFGYHSAEAHVANCVWRALQKKAQTVSPAR